MQNLYDQNTINKSEKLINQYLQSSFTVSKFCLNNNINYRYFQKTIDIIKQNNVILYQKFKTAEEENEKNYVLTIENNINMILNKIKNGVKDKQGNLREYDVIDYYIDKIAPTKELEKVSKKMKDKENSNILIDFLRKNKVLGKTKKINEDVSFTEQEKKIICFLKDNNIPINELNLEVALNKYKNENLFSNEHKMKENPMEQDINIMKDVILDYMNSNLRKTDYCNKTNIKLSVLRSYIQFMKDNYTLESLSSNEFLKEFLDIKIQILCMIDKIKNGVESVDGNKRKYDVIDFYKDKTLPNRHIYAFAQEVLEKEELLQLKKFLNANRLIVNCYASSFCGYNLNIENILTDSKEVNCKKDEFGNIIIGTGRLVTTEEKLATMEFLKQHHIPLTDRYYDLALNRYLEGTLIDKETENNLKKVYKKRCE